MPRLFAVKNYYLGGSINIPFLTERRPLKISIMPGNLPREQNVFHARAGADVMHDQVTLRRFVPDIDDHANVIDTVSQIPGDDIARQKSLAAAGRRQRLGFASEVGLQVRHAPTIDVRIGSAQSPAGRISRK